MAILSDEKVASLTRRLVDTVIDYRKEAERLAIENETLRAALDVCDRVLHFDLRKMITWGDDYNQAVKDAADAARAALEGKRDDKA